MGKESEKKSLEKKKNKRADRLKDSNIKETLDFFMPEQQKWCARCTLCKEERFHRRSLDMLVTKVTGKPTGSREEDRSPEKVLSSRWGNTEGKQWQIEAVISTWEKETGLPCSEKERILKDMGLNGIKWNMGLHEMLLQNNNFPWYNFASLFFKERKHGRSIPFGFNNTW